MLQWISGRPEETRRFLTAVQCDSTLPPVLLGGGTDFCSSEFTQYVSCFSVAIKHHDQEQFNSVFWLVVPKEWAHHDAGVWQHWTGRTTGLMLSGLRESHCQFQAWTQGSLEKKSLSFSKIRTWLSDFFCPRGGKEVTRALCSKDWSH